MWNKVMEESISNIKERSNNVLRRIGKYVVTYDKMRSREETLKKCHCPYKKAHIDECSLMEPIWNRVQICP